MLSIPTTWRIEARVASTPEHARELAEAIVTSNASAVVSIRTSPVEED